MSWLGWMGWIISAVSATIAFFNRRDALRYRESEHPRPETRSHTFKMDAADRPHVVDGQGAKSSASPERPRATWASSVTRHISAIWWSALSISRG